MIAMLPFVLQTNNIFCTEKLSAVTKNKEQYSTMKKILIGAGTVATVGLSALMAVTYLKSGKVPKIE